MEIRDYKDITDYFNNLPPFVPKKTEDGIPMFDLRTITALMEELGNPQDDLKIVHVAGTNGKGSTTQFINQICTEAGYKTGVFTSPYFETIREEIRIGNQLISEEDFTYVFREVAEATETIRYREGINASEFEIVVACAFVYFKKVKCDIVLLEVGLGGTYDATNVVKNTLLSVITPISIDHTEILGDTVESIAFVKAGIIKDNSCVVVSHKNDGVIQVFKEQCELRNSSLEVSCVPENVRIHEDGTTFEINGDEYTLSMRGLFQPDNATLAICAAMKLSELGFHISDESIRGGLKKAQWSARFELIKKNPDVIIDGAHNRAGIEALRNSLQVAYGSRKKIFIIGVLKDKDYREMLRDIVGDAEYVFCVEPNNPLRALHAEELAEYVRSCGTDAEAVCSGNLKSDYIKAYDMARGRADEDTVICIFGSFYFVGMMRGLVQEI